MTRGLSSRREAYYNYEEHLILPHDYLRTMEDLSDAQYGRLIRTLQHYAITGEIIPLVGNERFLFAPARYQIEDQRKISKQSMERRHAAAKKAAGCRWECQSQPKESHSQD